MSESTSSTSKSESHCPPETLNFQITMQLTRCGNVASFQETEEICFLKTTMYSTGWQSIDTLKRCFLLCTITLSVQALPNTEKYIPLVSFKILCSGERNSDNGDLDGTGNTSGELGKYTSMLEYSHQPCSDSEDHSVVSACSSVIYQASSCQF